jgi:hypothetical protein
MNAKLMKTLKLEGKALSAEFKKASVSGRGTPQEVADFREAAFRPFLARFFPFPYRVTKGIVTDSYGGESASIDCVLIHPRHPHTVDRDEKFSVIMADGVHAVVEIKPDLQNRAELERGLGQLQSVRKLRRLESALMPSLRNPIDPAILEDSKRVPCFLYAERIKVDPLKTVTEIARFYVDNQIPAVEQIDFVVVNRRGIIANYKFKQRCPWPDGPGLYWEGWKDSTIAAFLLHMNWVTPPEMHLMEPMLTGYLRGIGAEEVCKVHSW